jgi:putative nucleotidyltransferase with HDIG domain
MRHNFSKIFRHGPEIFRGLLVLASLAVLLYFFPGRKNFMYEYKINKPWVYPDLYAPFDFVVSYPPGEIRRKMDSIERHSPLVLIKKKTDKDSIARLILTDVRKIFPSDSALHKKNIALVRIVDTIYRRGWVNVHGKLQEKPVFLRTGKKEIKPITDLPFTGEELKKFLQERIRKEFPANYDEILRIFYVRLIPDYRVDKHYSERMLNEELSRFNPNKKIIYKGELIAVKGKKIDADTYEILESLKKSYFIDYQTYRNKLFGFFMIAAFFLSILMFFLYMYDREVFRNNSGITMIYVLIVLLTTGIFLTAEHFPGYIYVIPVIIVPYILKSFFNWRVSLLSAMVIIFLAAFGVRYPFEFSVLQLAASLTVIIGTGDLTRRSKMFISAGRAVLVYIFMYIALEMLTKGSWENLDKTYFILFVINGFLAVALVHELILIFEKTFNIVSDVSLLELLNTNNPLLRKLAEKAPGTFQHSLQVANLAESVANELNANSLLVRVGAMYHDIGKMKNPKYFTENQTGNINPHDGLPPEKSAEIIINHVLEGIEMARRNNLPERVIDFIRTHHGTGLVKYFYDKAKKENPGVDENKFRYPGPNPFSKETAIVMMADSVEAASKSLKNPTREQMNHLVDKIIDDKTESGLLNNADITLKDIQTAKKVLKNKLKSIYHLRVEYPESVFEKNKEKS